MSGETTNGAAVAAPAGPSPEVVDAVLRWPADQRAWLARLLADSVRDGFTSMAEADRRTREMIRSRIEDVVNGRVPLLDMDEVLDELDRRYGAEGAA